MALIIIRCFLLLLFLLFAIASANIIQDECGRTPSPQLCIKYLSEKPESPSSDAHQLAEIGIRVVAEVGLSASTFIKKALEGAQNDTAWQPCLDDCSELYVDAVDLMDSCTAKMEVKAYEEVNVLMSAAIGDAQACQLACKDGVFPEKATIAKMNDEFSNLCGAIRSIVDHLPMPN